MELAGACEVAEVCADTVVIEKARQSIETSLPDQGLGLEAVNSHLRDEICAGLSNSSRSSRYFGFVIGGTTPAAAAADNIVTEYDQNVSVHIPNQSIAADVEFHTLNMLCQLLRLSPDEWEHKTLTTGATASNIMGLICGRDYVLEEAARRQGLHFSVCKDGLLEAAGVAKCQILCTAPHSSIRKAAAIVGLGHNALVDCGDCSGSHRFSMEKLEQALSMPKIASIILIASCEVNAGMFAVQDRQEMEQIRRLADRFGAWVHADAAMGFMARLLPRSREYAHLSGCVDGLELVDSITGDGHKLLNVPYDTGFFLSRHASGVRSFQNPGAAYLATSVSAVPAPLNLGLENSRRFRALPLYANLVAYGRLGYQEMIERQIQLTRIIAAYLFDSEKYEIYQPRSSMTRTDVVATTFMIVMFRAKDEKINAALQDRINSSRKMFVSKTTWEGRPAVRIAVANWQCSPGRDWPIICEVLKDAVNG